MKSDSIYTTPRHIVVCICEINANKHDERPKSTQHTIALTNNTKDITILTKII